MTSGGVRLVAAMSVALALLVAPAVAPAKKLRFPPESVPTSAVVAPDGSIVVGGFRDDKHRIRGQIARFLPNGKPDPEFRAPLLGNSLTVISDVAVQPDGKIVAVGSGAPADGKTFGFVLWRFLSNGTLDPAFGNNGVTNPEGTPYDAAAGVAVQPDGRIVVTIYSPNILPGTQVFTRRYTPTGNLDPSFGTAGQVVDDFGRDPDDLTLAILPDGRIEVAAVLGATKKGPAQLLSTMYSASGVRDTGYGPAGHGQAEMGVKIKKRGGFPEQPAVVIQPDGRAVGVVGEALGKRSANLSSHFVRLGVDGFPDPTFGRGGFASVPVPFLNYPAVGTGPDGSFFFSGSGSFGRFSSRYVVKVTDGRLNRSFGRRGTAQVRNSSALINSAFASAPDGSVAVAIAAPHGRVGFTLIRFRPNGKPYGQKHSGKHHRSGRR